MRAIENAADIIMKNMWFIFQCIFLVYISALAVMDFKFRKLLVRYTSRRDSRVSTWPFGILSL